MGYRLKREALEPIEVEVTALAHDGRGVARHDGKTVFVAGALPGERVRCQRYRLHRQYDEARLVDVLQASADRVTPRCAAFGTCGGCMLQQLPPARQIVFKQEQLAQELARIGRVEPVRWLEPLTGPAWNYRRRARLGARYVPRKERSLVGFRERASSHVTETARCEVLAVPVDGLLGPLGDLLGQLSIRARVPQIEVACGAASTVLVLRVLDAPATPDLDLLRDFAKRHGVEFWLQRGGPDTAMPLDPPGASLRYALPEFDLTLDFLPTDFVQVNAPLNERMVTQAVGLLAPGPGERVLDLFCGLGNFALALARRAGTVTGVEGERGLVERARANAVQNGIGNAVFFTSNLFEPDTTARWARGAYDKVLLDPPRAGAREILPLVAASGAVRVVYVSCHPGSLARDAGILVQEHGFRLAAAGVMDLFPHTAHVESIAVFERGVAGVAGRAVV
ncbi:MAG: 23S rRNA (uracil(1939)-C(5))-methyltransferase RlmD [Gammaproteobacteria bacterium]|nr:23S rRNA (uracil(1939)-C(5))-methyltransferase RlmD [Gammaproteobacteria bacterium]